MGLDFGLEVDLGGPEPIEVHSANITHNVKSMWAEAGVYSALYESHGQVARTVLPALKGGLKAMTDDPDRYRKMDSPNGWGTYEDAAIWIAQLIEEIERMPNAIIYVSK